MASARSAWGIDLGNRALKAVKLVRDGDRFRIDDFEIIEHEQILSVAGDNKEGLLRTALANFVERHQTKGAAVGVSVSGQSSFARFIKLPPVEPKKIPEIVKFEAIQQIPFPLDDVEWSYQLFQEQDSPDVEVGIFAMRKDLVNRQIGFFTDHGLNVQVVQMSPLAVYNGMYYDDRIHETAMFMDSGAENTDLIIADGQTVWLRTLPIGGNNFTETLAKSFKLSFAKAEELKRNAATSKYAKQIFQAMRPVFADLVAEIQRSIGFYASVHRDARINRIIALGGTFQLPGLQKYLQQNLQLPVEKLDGFRAVPPTDSKMAATLNENTISLAGAYGLAVQAMGDAKITSSLLPATIRRQKMWQEKTKWFAAAAATFAVGTVAAAGSYFYHDTMYAQNEPVRAETRDVIQTASNYSSEWSSKVENQGANDRQQVLKLRALQDYRLMWMDLTQQIMGAAPSAPIDKLKPVPRGNREIIAIDQLLTAYRPDLGFLLVKAPSFADLASQQTSLVESESTMRGNMVRPNSRGGRGGAGATDMMEFERAMGLSRMDPTAGAVDPTADTRRGFLITIKGYTPHKDGVNFVQKRFVKALIDQLSKEKALAAKVPYYIDKIEVIASARRNLNEADATGIGGYGGAVGRGSYSRRTDTQDQFKTDADGKPLLDEQGRPIPKVDPLEDRQFPGERITSDIQFTVLMAVVLDPTKEDAAAAADAALGQ